MKKYLLFFKGLILLCLIISSIFMIYYFLYYNEYYAWDSIDVEVNAMITISYFIVFFYLLLFLINFKKYNIIFLVVTVCGVILWITIYILELLKIEATPWNWYNIREVGTILCFSIFSPGITLNIIRYIRYKSNQNKQKKIFQNYHFHEGFVGIIFVIIALFLWLIRTFMIQFEIIRKQLRIFLAIEMIMLFVFLFSGSFLIFRDWRDIIRFKFIEKEINSSNAIESAIFKINDPKSTKFFSSPPILLYPFGIFLNSVSVSLFIHGTNFISFKIFHLSHETLVFIGFILCFIAGGLLGIDWYRVFAKIYPNLYQEFEQVLKDLKKSE
ncbi:MAG: hypothetical protein ACFFCV_03575 [Promethearchaeota archaeon]